MTGKEHITREDDLSSMRSEVRRSIGSAMAIAFVFAVAAMALHASLTLLNRDCRLSVIEASTHFSPVNPSESTVWMQVETSAGMAVDERNSFSTDQPLKKSRSVFLLPPRRFSGDRPSYRVPYFTFQKILWAALPVRAGPSPC